MVPVTRKEVENTQWKSLEGLIRIVDMSEDHLWAAWAKMQMRGQLPEAAGGACRAMDVMFAELLHRKSLQQKAPASSVGRQQALF